MNMSFLVLYNLSHLHQMEIGINILKTGCRNLKKVNISKPQQSNNRLPVLRITDNADLLSWNFLWCTVIYVITDGEFLVSLMWLILHLMTLADVTRHSHSVHFPFG